MLQERGRAPGARYPGGRGAAVDPEAFEDVLEVAALAAAAMLSALVALGPAAFAQHLPPEPAPAPRVSQNPIVIQHGSPLWVFAVVAIVAIAVTVGMQALLGHAVHRRLAHT